MNPINLLKEAYTRRAAGYLNSFLDCVQVETNVTTSVYLNNFMDKTFRDAVCDGEEGHCNSTFCDRLATKTKMLKDNGICESFAKFGDWYASCAINFIAPNSTKGDETCRKVAIDILADTSGGWQIGFQEVALFLECPEAMRMYSNSSVDKFALPVPTAKGPIGYLHYEVTKAYLGSASTAVASFMSVIFAACLVVLA
jgi:hypothetical protein